MRALVTGATGYVGHSLALALAQKGDEVNIIVRNPVSASIPLHPNIHIFKGDITDKATITPAIKGCENIFHTAALVKSCSKNAADFYEINVEGTRKMLESALSAGIKKFVFTSTAGVIGPLFNRPMSESDPRVTGFDNDYELSKFMAEKLVIEYSQLGLFTVIASPSKVFGPGLDTHHFSVNGIIRRFLEGKIIFYPGPASFISNYVFIDDLVKGHILAMEKGRSGEKYILGGETLSYTDFFQMLRTLTGMKAILLPVPKTVAKLYGGLHYFLSRLLNKEIYLNAKSANHVFCNKSFTSEKAQRELGYAITPFASALQQTIHFLKNEIYAN